MFIVSNLIIVVLW